MGPEGETIHVDEWGRIKVRFLFTRSDDHGHDGGAGSNDNDTDSAWVDVLTPWAGEGYGARFYHVLVKWLSLTSLMAISTVHL